MWKWRDYNHMSKSLGNWKGCIPRGVALKGCLDRKDQNDNGCDDTISKNICYVGGLGLVAPNLNQWEYYLNGTDVMLKQMSAFFVPFAPTTWTCKQQMGMVSSPTQGSAIWFFSITHRHNSWYVLDLLSLYSIESKRFKHTQTGKIYIYI